MSQLEELLAIGIQEGASGSRREGFDTGENEGDEGGEDEGLCEEDKAVEEQPQRTAGDIGEGALPGIDGIGAFAGDGGDEQWPADEVSSDDEDSDQGQADGGDVDDGAQDVEDGPPQGHAAEGDDAPENGDEEDGSGNGEEA